MLRKSRLKDKELSVLKEIREISLTSHSKKEPPIPCHSKTSLSQRKEKMPWRNWVLLINQAHPKLRVEPRERRRLHPNQLPRRELRNQLNQQVKWERPLIRSSNTLQANQLERKTLLKKERHQLPRDQSQRRLHLFLHPVERNQPELLIKWPWLNSRNTWTGMKRRREERAVQLAKYWEREVQVKYQLHLVRVPQRERNLLNEWTNIFRLILILLKI